METPYEVFLGSVLGPLRAVLPALVSNSSVNGQTDFPI